MTEKGVIDVDLPMELNELLRDQDNSLKPLSTTVKFDESFG